MEEDISASSLETILFHGGSLGFYQKRLFLCSCFLQALTVSALIYASHCRPPLSPPSSPVATNGAAVDGLHYSKCASTTNFLDSVISTENTTFAVVERSTNKTQSNFRRDKNRSKRSAVTKSSVMAEVKKSDIHAQSSLSTTDTNVPAPTSSPSTKTVSRKRRHRWSKHTNRLALKKTSRAVTSVYDVTPTSSTFKDFIVNTYVEISKAEWYPATSSAIETDWKYGNGENSGIDDYAWVDEEGVLDPSVTASGNKPAKNKRDLKGRTTDAGTVIHISSSDFVDMTHTDNADSTVTVSDGELDCGEGSGADNVETGGLIYLTLTYLPAPEWLGDVDNEQLAQYNAYCQAVGAMLGAAMGAMGADQMGRRKPLYAYFSFMLLAHCMSGVAVSWTMLVVFRFIVGMFAGACAVVSLVFPLEFIGTEWRDVCTCSGLWVVGVGVISLELLVTRHWRYLAFISGGIGLPLIGTYFITSESARWLLCNQKFPDAEATLKEVMSCNSTCVSDFLSLFDKSRACVVTNMHPKRYTFLDLFHSIEMTKWTFALVYTCLVASSVYFCLLSKVKAMTGYVYLDNSLPFVIDLPLGWSAVVVNRCLGRRWCLFLYAVASGLALLSVLVLHMTGNLSHMPSMLTGMAVFGKIGVTASLGLVFVIAVEMYPTVIRCMGVAVAVASVSGGFLLADTLLFLDGYHYTVPFVVLGTLMSSVGFAGLLFPETLRRPLPNIMQCRHRSIPLYEGMRLVGSPLDIL